MYEYLKGTLAEVNPTYAVVDCGGVGYCVNITLNTYSKIATAKEVLLFTHYIVREDAQLLYGFGDKDERALFRLLISVSGIGANTACVMLSSMNAAEIVNAIATENVNAIKSVKGIGLKTAQRVIIELKDKVGGMHLSDNNPALPLVSTVQEEALAALVMLGFAKAQASKALEKIATQGVTTVEDMIKHALKML